MLTKNPKPAYKKWIKRGAATIFVLEAASFAATYYGWSRLNTDRDSRKFLRENCPPLLEVYYKTGEYLNPESQIRHIDNLYWSNEN